MNTWSILVILPALLLTVSHPNAHARRTHLTTEQLDQLQKAQTIHTNVIALSEAGRYDPTPLQDTLNRRLEEVGYTVITDISQPHDVRVKLKCEERKTWSGTTPEGGDAELPDAPARLWKGPACIFSYSLEGKDLGWKKEVRTNFEDPIQAAKAAGNSNSGQFAMEALTDKIATYDFPVLLSAEWGQSHRLLKILNDPATHQLRKLKILSVLSDLQSQEAIPQLTEIMKEKDLAQEAILALSGVGTDSLPILIDLLATARQPDIQAAAAKALGDVAAASGDPRCIPPLVSYLNSALTHMTSSKDINFPVLTAVVWSLGKLRDDLSIAPVAELNQRVWLIYDNSPEMTELREATNWTYKQLDLDGHVS